MKPLYLAAVLAALPVAASAQVHFNVRCLPEAKQSEIKSRAQAITAAADAKREAVKPAMSVDSALGLRNEKQTALGACYMQARQDRQAPGVACEKEINELRDAAQLVDEIANGSKKTSREIDSEERRNLEALRAEYPTCPTTLGPDNAVIRK